MAGNLGSEEDALADASMEAIHTELQSLLPKPPSQHSNSWLACAVGKAEAFIVRVTRPHVSSSSTVVSILLVLCSCITSTTFGYDGSMMNGLNMLPGYKDYFRLTTATMSLATASLWIGGAIAGLTYGKVTDAIGRRQALFWAATLTLISVIIQTLAQSITIFIIGRIFVGYGTSASTLAGPTFVAETLPYHWRAWGLGLLNDCYYVGGLIAAGVTYYTSTIGSGYSTWAWRVPSAIQGAFSILCILILPFVPESPRWLIYQNRSEEALEVVAQTHADGDITEPRVLAHFKQIKDTIDFEKTVGEALSLKEIFSSSVSRKRVSLAISTAIFSTVSGNIIAGYYLGGMLTNAGVKDVNTQLQINIFLNIWCLCSALAGTYYCDQIGRRLTGVISTASLSVFIFLIGVLTNKFGSSSNTSGIYGTVASVFLFQGAYSFGWTPLLYLYPPEVLNYPIRAIGMGVFTFVLNGAAILFVFSFPFAMESLGWIAYLLNGSWDVLEVIFIWFFWVETKGKTLEEIGELFDGKMRRNVPDQSNLG
ncbi:MFS sugar transporter-like protein [Bisporella sp. PMI_857]|nr:MFS sugar transporter-like protein [Bisporella sp. PMI_857]